MGKSSAPVVGYWYSMGLHMGLCVGPIDALLQITAGDQVAWTGNLTASGQFSIAQPDLFGGEKKEGGIDGTAWLMMGEDTQAPNTYLQAQLGTPCPAFRGLACVVFQGRVAALNPYVKQWAFQCQKFIAGWRTAVWQPTLCQIDKGMNAAHLLYRCITDPVTGLGLPESALDLDAMLSAAQTLSNEGLGLCLRWARSDVIGNFIGLICSHVGGVWVDNPFSGKQYLKLLRGDYDIDTCPVLDESNIIELTSYEPSALAGSVNEVTVTYRDCVTNKDANVTVQNLANVQAQGRIVNQTNQYSGIWSADLATRVAMRDLRALSSMPVKIQCKAQASLSVVQGDVLAFSWAALNVSKMPVRVIEVDYGTPADSTLTLTSAQDVYALPTQAYVVGQSGLWQAPNTTPAALAYQRLIESSYRDLALRLRAADIAQLSATSGFVGALGAAPAGVVAYNYTMTTSVSSSAYKEVASGAFAPTATLIAAMPLEAGPTSVTLANLSRLDQVELATEVLIDDEIMRVDALDPIAGTATLARGCVDTVPSAHAAGARVWFTDGFTGADPTEYISGETVQAKLLTRTSAGTLDTSAATALSVTLAGRQALPYPPGAIQINSAAYPATVSDTFMVTWAHRNSVIQADQLIDTTAAGVTPPEDMRYGLRFLAADSTQLVARTDVAGATASVVLDYTGTVTMQIYAITDAGESLQRHEFSFAYTPPAGGGASQITATAYTGVTETVVHDGGTVTA